MSNLILYNPEEQISMLYDKKITCPVCGSVFKAKAIKKNSYRIIKKDPDFFIRYSRISPYFYDVWVCDECGYASIKADFEKLSDYDADTIKEQLTPKWHRKNFPEVYDIDLAIQRYKLSLLNYYTINARPSKKAMNCLKLAWMYRLKEDSKNEMTFLKQALENLNSAYFNESFPMYGMNKFTAMYLIGELMRRTGTGEKSLIWFSQVITSTMASEKIKDLARQQKNLVNEGVNEDSINDQKNQQQMDKKKGLFNKFRI
ncbi:DUF2225 domain-containing protein [Clostridium tyrobutyricum]|uniref:DUF2225 domain-containing protein n=1 Tax=Clostridium tyrobutyricum TaxID=1519 RepID=UPI0020CC349E|nr:DUF2225 domain-containing protein [Clostridium tyrobutyricum]